MKWPWNQAPAFNLEGERENGALFCFVAFLPGLVLLCELWTGFDDFATGNVFDSVSVVGWTNIVSFEKVRSQGTYNLFKTGVLTLSFTK